MHDIINPKIKNIINSKKKVNILSILACLLVTNDICPNIVKIGIIKNPLVTINKIKIFR